MNRPVNKTDSRAVGRVIEKQQLPRTVLDCVKSRLGKWVDWKYIIGKLSIDTFKAIFEEFVKGKDD